MFEKARREKRKRATRQRLIDHAFQALNNGHPGWRQRNASVYGAALAHVVPLFTELLVFGDAAPPLLKNAWKRLPDDEINRLASFISWRLACSSFQDLAPGDEVGRNRLMDITGTLFPCSNHGAEKRWYALVNDPSPLFGTYLVEQAGDATVHRNVDAFILADILGASNLPSNFDARELSDRKRDERALSIVYLLTTRGQMLALYRNMSNLAGIEAIEWNEAPVYKDFPALVKKEARVRGLVRKENRATFELAASVVDAYDTYYECAKDYLERGDYTLFLQSLMLGADYYSFAANNYFALGDRSSALRSLRVGKGRIEDALSRATLYTGGKYETDTARAELSETLRAIDRMLGELAAIDD
jgi:hypothetical protein